MQGEVLVGDATTRETAKDAAALMLRHMVRLRVVSARMVDLQREGAIASHASSIGEEAPIVAAALAARGADWIFPGAREWGVALVRGMPLERYVHHAFGSALDPAKGHAAPDHAPARAWNVAPASGVVGAQIPQAVGAAWAAKTKKDAAITIALFGDGATSTGDFHNAMNFAGVFKAPCVMICRNNRRAVSTPSSRQTKSASFADKAVAYGVASARLDGSDPLAVLALVEEAVARAAAGKGATLIEILTAPPSPESFEGADVLAYGDADPIGRLRAHAHAHEHEHEHVHEHEQEHERFVAAVRAEIDAAVAAARRAGPPAPASMFDDVYAAVPAHLHAQKESVSWRK